jgi:hypothetical protein
MPVAVNNCQQPLMWPAGIGVTMGRSGRRHSGGGWRGLAGAFGAAGGR